jgi:hypothetical protein
MKKILFLLVVTTMALAACIAVPAVEPTQGFLAPVANGLVAIPPELNDAIGFGVTALLTWVLVQAGLAMNLDLTGYLTPLVAVLSPIIVTLAENALGTIPPAFDNIVLTLIHLGILILGSLGVLTFVRKQARSTVIGEG